MTLQIGPLVEVGFVDTRRGVGQTETTDLATPLNYSTHATLDARLTAISATSYSAKRLRMMTQNDKVYAVRLNDDAAGV
jgi:hypothetical protein